jgi:hypothetical protein
VNTVRLFFAHWDSSKEFSLHLWQRVVLTWNLTRFRGQYSLTTPDVTRIQRAAIELLENAAQSIYDRQGELLLQGIREGEEVRSNFEAFYTLCDAMRRVESEEDSTDTEDEFRGVVERDNILMFPINRKHSTANQ